MLPVENTTAGSINDVYDLLSCAQVSIVGEEVLRVEHCLLGVGRRAADVAAARALAPAGPRAVHEVPVEAAELRAAALHRHGHGGAAGEGAATTRPGPPSPAKRPGRRYGLKVLRRNVEDQQHNYTRFVVVAKHRRARRSADPVQDVRRHGHVPRGRLAAARAQHPARVQDQPDEAREPADPRHAVPVPLLHRLRGQHRRARRCRRRWAGCVRRRRR